MIWIDIATPKYAMFFGIMYPELIRRGHQVLVTTRSSPGYTEAVDILRFLQIPHQVLGNYGGATTPEKFRARLSRQQEMLKLFETTGQPRVLFSGTVVDSVQVAFGLGMKVVSFADTPSTTVPGDWQVPSRLTTVARLTLPFSSLVFYPFIMPSSMFDNLALHPDQLIPYDFIDVCLWMDRITADPAKDFRKKYGLDLQKPTILIREEEFKAHYVKEKIPVLYQAIHQIAKDVRANLVIIPRYESAPLKAEFSNIAHIIEEKIRPEELYPFIDLLIGGGGTMNLEAVYFGIPTISTRSIWLYHDQYLMKNHLMHWTNDPDEVVRLSKMLLGTRVEARPFFSRGEKSFRLPLDRIEHLRPEGLEKK
jgi:hypothetical protein